MATTLTGLKKKLDALREQVNANERRGMDLREELNSLTREVAQAEKAADPLLNMVPTNGLIVSFVKTFGGTGRYIYVAVFEKGYWYATQNGGTIGRRTHKTFIEWARLSDPNVKFYVLEPNGMTLEELA